MKQFNLTCERPIDAVSLNRERSDWNVEVQSGAPSRICTIPLLPMTTRSPTLITPIKHEYLVLKLLSHCYLSNPLV